MTDPSDPMHSDDGSPICPGCDQRPCACSESGPAGPHSLRGADLPHPPLEQPIEPTITCSTCRSTDGKTWLTHAPSEAPRCPACHATPVYGAQGLVVDLSTKIEQALSEGGASAADHVIACAKFPHGYETDHAAFRAIVTLYSEATTDATIAYYAAPCDGPEHKASLARMSRLDMATNELRARLARTYPEAIRDRLADLVCGEHVISPSDRAWRDRIASDAFTRLQGYMSRPLPESADLVDDGEPTGAGA